MRCANLLNETLSLPLPLAGKVDKTTRVMSRWLGESREGKGTRLRRTRTTVDFEERKETRQMNGNDWQWKEKNGKERM